MSSMFSGCSSLRAVALGEKFSFNGAKGSRQCNLPKPSGNKLTGLWENQATGESYSYDDVPNNVNATYTAQPVRTTIQDSMFKVDTESVRYTGAPIEKSISTSLVDERDYTVKYEDNIEIGTAMITIIGAGDYTGTLTYRFEILKAVPEYEVPDAIDASYGQLLGELALPKGFSWQSPSTTIENVGDSVYLATFTPDDTDHYECVRDIPVTVRVPWVEVEIPTLDDIEYSGQPQKAAVPENDQYRVVSNEGGTDAGTYTVELALTDPTRCRWSDGSGGNKMVSYRILPTTIEKAVLSPIPSAILADGPATPEPAVSLNGTVLVKGKDYALSYENNEIVGTGTVIVTGMGNYSGGVRADFQIRKYTDEIIDITNPGDCHIGNGQEQSKDVPYTSYSNYGLTEALYTADEIKAAGGAAGKITNIAFKVAQPGALETSSVKIYFGLTSESSLGKFVDAASLTLVYEGSPTLGGSEGWEELELTAPFEYDGSSNLIIAVSKASGGYSETLRYEATSMKGMAVARQSGSSASYADVRSAVAGSDPGVRPNIRLATHAMLPEVTMEVPAQTYTGSPLCPEPTVRFGDKTLVCGEDYDVSYANNVDAGTATAVVVGKGEFSGERIIDFEIAPLDISSAVAEEPRIVEISEGMASDSNVPFATQAYYSLSEQLYTADEIRENGGSAGTINSMAFHISKNGALKGDSRIYYIGSTSKTELRQGDVISDVRSVKGRIIGCDADGWQTITFGEPYQWDGESNLVVAVYVSCPPYYVQRNSTLEYYGSYIDDMCVYSDSYDPKTPGDFFSRGLVSSPIRPDIRFSMDNLAVSVKDIGVQYATGSALQPQVSVSLEGRILDKDDDYTVSYEDNVNPGTGYAIVEGVGNFKGSQRAPFTIASASFAEDGELDVSIGDTSGKRSCSPYAPTGSFSDGDHLGVTQSLYKASEIAASGGAKGLIDGISYYSSGNASFSPKKVKIYIEATDLNALWYMESASQNYPSSSRDFFSYEDAMLVYEGTPTLGREKGWERLDLLSSFEYDGKSNLLVTVVTDADLVSGSYSADSVKGAFLSGCEGRGSSSAYANLSCPSIKFSMRANLLYAVSSDIATQPYQGAPVEPKLLLRFGGRALEEGADYELSYESNDAVGTGVVVATGIGNYTGEKRMEFAIGNDIAEATASPIADETYCGSAIEPKPVLSFDGRTLEEGVDYELSYKSNVNAGVGIVVATGIGRQFAGEKRIEFHIEQADIADESVQAISAQDYTGLPLEPVLYVGNLEPRVDYDLSYEDNVEIGTATVIATGKGNYKGVRKSTFRIAKADIHDDHTVIVNDKNSDGYNLKDGETAVWGFSLTSDSLVSIITSQTSLLSAGNALHLALRDDDGKIAFEWSEPALPNVNTRGLMFLHKGRWHLSVTALGKQSYGSDRPVIVGVTGGSVPGGVEREYNDSFESATTIGTNSPLMWGALFNPASDVSGRYMDDDYWTFTLKRPAKTKVALSSTADAARACDFSLFDETGAPVEKDGLPLEGTSKGKRLQTVLDCGELPAGKYYVKVSLGNASCWNSQYAIKVNADSSISLDDCSIAVDQGSVFNGSAQKPLVVMKNASGILLIEGQDYSVEYRDNVNAGYGTVVVKGMGAYSGERSETFEISPAVVDEPEAVADLVYNAHEQVGVAHGDLFSVSGGSATDAGSYTATVSLIDKQNYEWPGSGNSDDIEVSWSIAKALLTFSMVSDVPSSMEATGSQLAPEPIVTFNGKTLVQGADYSLSYGENVSPGKGTVTVTAIEGGNFTGSATVEFDIEKKAEPAPEPTPEPAPEPAPGPQQFAVIYHLDGGANAADNPATYMAGTAVPLADPTKEGFEFQGWYADAEFTVRVTEIPADASGDVELWAKWKEQKPAPVFTDVDYSDTSWYGDAVTFVAEKGLITGYSGTTLFGVGDVLTRAQLATILWRNACPDEYASYDPETAVDTTGLDGSADGMYYTAAANWAVRNGVITGFDREDGSKDFAADDDVSFEQLVTILSRLCATPEELSAAGSDLSAFADGDLASSWSRGAFAWAAAKGLVQGYDEPTGRYLRPGDPVARERVAVVLMRAFEMGLLK
ncbi:S-layer homology domain-containing protein [Ellagibacter isourolithinifaciens]|uniref:S-layer homology domain-containing protein n=1 Tax=Ellagibacter isourolithinifaciens TaxID=2137581 RepID=UPI003A8ECAD3